MPFSDLTPGNEIAGGTDGTSIGNVGDRLKTDVNGSVSSTDVANTAYVSGLIQVTNVQTEAKVGASRLSGRKILLIYNHTGGTVYYGASGVTSTTGIALVNGAYVSLPVGGNIPVYVINTNLPGNPQPVRIQELA